LLTYSPLSFYTTRFFIISHCAGSIFDEGPRK
jgi:hypothetical protein